jgi:hypothetical protein
MTSSINRYCDSRVVKRVVAMASLATGVGMTRISAQELFDHQERTSTQILTIALPIFARFAFRRDLFTVGRLNRDEEDEQARD